MGIRGKYEVLPIEGDDRTVIHGLQPDTAGVVMPESGEGLEQFPHHFAAGAMHHVDFHLIFHLNLHIGDYDLPALHQFRKAAPHLGHK